MLTLSNISQSFYRGTVNEKHALRKVSIEIAEGEFVTVIGSNGAGKSTLLNVVAGKLHPDSGTVTIEGRDVTAPEMTIEENLAIAYTRGKARRLRRGVTKQRRDLFAAELATLEQGLESRLKTRVATLSGGQRQALSLLMATFSEPKILLLDEHP